MLLLPCQARRLIHVGGLPLRTSSPPVEPLIADYRQTLTNGPDFQPAREALEMTQQQKRGAAPTAGDS